MESDNDSIISDATSMVVGENGDLSHKSSGHAGLDLHFALVRGLNRDVIRGHIKTIIDSGLAIDDLFILLFATRNCRGGKGERVLSYEMFEALYEHFPNTCHNILHLFGHYGYWKDLLNLIERHKSTYGTINGSFYEKPSKSRSRSSSLSGHEIVVYLADKCIEVLANKLKEDIDNSEKGLPISLAAKYAPRQSMHFARYCPHQFDLLVESLVGSNDNKKYRKIISDLSRKIDIVESHMCANEFSKIDFKKAPSICVKKFRQAFLNESLDPMENDSTIRFPDREDRMTCRENLLSILSTGKIKGGQIQPHEIIESLGMSHGCMNLRRKTHSCEEILLLEAQWNSMRETLKAKFTKPILAMSDVSGSMCSGSSKVIPMYVSVALGILLSELCEGPYHNKVLTFSGSPRYVDLSGTLTSKVKQITEDKSCEMNTNLIAAFQLILSTALENNITEIPSLVIFSDMQFDSACENKRSTFEVIDKMFTDNGLIRPTLIYWNLNTNEGVPVMKDEINTVLMSGFSPSLFKYLLFGDEIPTPLSIYQNMLLDDIYQPVRDVLAACGGALVCR